MNYIDFLEANKEISIDSLGLTELDFAIFSEFVYHPLEALMQNTSATPMNQVDKDFLDYYITMPQIKAFLCSEITV